MEEPLWSGDGLTYLLPSPVGELTPAGLTPPPRSPFPQENSGLTPEGDLRAHALHLRSPHHSTLSPWPLNRAHSFWNQDREDRKTPFLSTMATLSAGPLNQRLGMKSERRMRRQLQLLWAPGTWRRAEAQDGRRVSQSCSTGPAPPAVSCALLIHLANLC